MGRSQRRMFIVLIGALLLIMSCKKNSSSPTSPNNSSGPPSSTVSMSGNAFSPATLTISPHTTVTWYNNSSVTHTSTSYTGKWDTGDITAGSSKTTTFDSVGIYPYHCIYHTGMVGTINVQ